MIIVNSPGYNERNNDHDWDQRQSQLSDVLSGYSRLHQLQLEDILSSRETKCSRQLEHYPDQHLPRPKYFQEDPVRLNDAKV